MKDHMVENRACPAGILPPVAARRHSRANVMVATFKMKEVKMPKMKTKSGAKKRFRLTASGRVRGSAAFLSHNLRRRSQKMKRQARGTMILCDADSRIVKKFLPYA